MRRKSIHRLDAVYQARCRHHRDKVHCKRVAIDVVLTRGDKRRLQRDPAMMPAAGARATDVLDRIVLAGPMSDGVSVDQHTF